MYPQTAALAREIAARGGLRLSGFDAVHLDAVHGDEDRQRVRVAARIFETFSVRDHTEFFCVDVEPARQVIVVSNETSVLVANQLKSKVVQWRTFKVIERTQAQHLRPHHRVLIDGHALLVTAVSYFVEGSDYVVHLTLQNRLRIKTYRESPIERLH